MLPAGGAMGGTTNNPNHPITAQLEAMAGRGGPRTRDGGGRAAEVPMHPNDRFDGRRRSRSFERDNRALPPGGPPPPLPPPQQSRRSPSPGRQYHYPNQGAGFQRGQPPRGSDASGGGGYGGRSPGSRSRSASPRSPRDVGGYRHRGGGGGGRGGSAGGGRRHRSRSPRRSRSRSPPAHPPHPPHRGGGAGDGYGHDGYREAHRPLLHYNHHDGGGGRTRRKCRGRGSRGRRAAAWLAQPLTQPTALPRFLRPRPRRASPSRQFGGARQSSGWWLLRGAVGECGKKSSRLLLILEIRAAFRAQSLLLEKSRR